MPGGSTTTTQVNKTELPQWVNDAGKANYDKAVALDKAPLRQYGGPLVAAPSAQTKNAFDYFNSHMNAGGEDTAAAADVFRRLSDPNAFKTGVAGYMDPYIDDVVNKGVGQIGDELTQSLMKNGDNATAAGAFGGSRAAIVDAVSHAQAAKDAGILSSQLRSQGFTDAANRFSANTTAEGQGLLATGDQKQQQMLKRFAGLEDQGKYYDTYGQKVIDSKVGQFNERRDKELNDLNVRLSALGMTPYNKTQNTTTNTPNPPPDFGAMGIGLISLLAGLV